MASEHHGAEHTKYQTAPTRLSELLLTLAHHPAGLAKQQLLQLVPSYRKQLEHSSLASVQRVLNRDLAALRRVGYTVLAQRARNAPHTVYSLVPAQQPAFALSGLEKLLLQAALKHWHSLHRGGNYFELLLKLAPHLYNPANPFAQLTVDNAAEMLLLGHLSAAISSHQQVQFNYARPGGTVHRRTVSPLRLHRAQERWHLLAYDQHTSTIRTFLLPRITDFALLQEPAVTVPAPAVTAKIHELQRVVGATTAALSFVTVTAAAQRLLRLYGGQPQASAMPGDYVINYGDTAVLAEQLAALDTAVVIHSPQQLRHSYDALLKTVTAQHAAPASENFALPAHTSAVPPPTGSRLATETRCLLHAVLLELLSETGDFLLLPVATLLGLSTDTLVTALTQLNELFNHTALPHYFGAAQLRVEFTTACQAASEQLQDDSGWVIMEGTAALPLPAFTAQDYGLLQQCLAALAPQLPPQLLTALRPFEKRLMQLAAGHNATAPAAVSSDTVDSAHSAAAELLAAHISAKKVVCFSYLNGAGKQTARAVVPLRLALSGNDWRLHGLCLTSMTRKNFLVARMSQLSVCSRAEYVAAHNLDTRRIGEILKGTVPGLAATHTAVTALVCVADTAKIKLHGFNPLYLASTAQLLPGANPDASLDATAATETAARERAISPAAAWHYAKIKLWDAANIVRVVQAAPGAVEVLQPPELRKLVATWAMQTAQTVSTQPTAVTLR